MKYLLLLIVIMFSGCNMIQDAYNYSKFEQCSIYYDDYSSIEDYRDVTVWIRNRVTFKKDDGDVWSTPKEIVERGYGDCDDFSRLFINIVYARFGIKMNLVCVDMDEMSRTIVDGGFTNHAIVEYKGVYYEPQNGLEYSVGKVGFIYTFKELFKI